MYIPESEEIKEEKNNELIVCKEILKTGINKGNPCGSKVVKDSYLCKRHNKN